MKQIIALLPLLAGIASAQDDVYKSLAVGDRVQVTFRGGGSLIGTLVPPPAVGPLSGRPKPATVDVKSSAAPFTLYVFTRKGDAASEAQVAVVDAWRKNVSEATVTVVAMEEKSSLDLAKSMGVSATPAVVIKDLDTGRTQTHAGLQSAERLSANVARLRSRIEEEKVDYTKEDFLTLDVRLEYPGLNGTMSIAKKDIKEVRKLQRLDEATRRRLEEEHRKIREVQANEEAARRDFEAKRAADAAGDIEKAEKEAKELEGQKNEGQALLEKAEKLKAQEALLKQFPPEQWNEERRKQIATKIAARLPVSPDEQAFMENQADWSEAVKARKEKEQKEKPSEEK
jgi:hypothetical protein